jgi:putative pyoverdin transport system ATP-binding/permease protein
LKTTLQLFLALVKWTGSIEGSRTILIGTTLAGMIAGLSNIAMIAVINSVLTNGISKPVVLKFLGLCVLIPGSGFTSQALLVRLTERATRDLRVGLSRQILSAPHRLLEELGIHRLLGTITDDISAVTQGITSLPFLGTQVAVISGCLAYLGWLSWRLLLVVLGFMVFGMLSYKLPAMKSVRHYHLMREGWDACFKGFRALTEGIKELKLNRKRSEAFLAQELEPALGEVYRQGVLAETVAIAASNWGQILFFLLIGFSLFLGSRMAGIDHHAMVGYTLTVLFMIPSLSGILSTQPVLGRAYVAAQKVNALSLSLTAHSLESEPVTEEICRWNRLCTHRLVHTYRRDGTPDEFKLGPIDLQLNLGEIVFITGGNGSGKTTLMKLLIGLYEPEEGTITLDGRAITPENQDSYRQLFSVVFYDFFLFERLYGLDHHESQKQAEQYLRRLQLGHKVSIENGKLSTTELSQGQRKRLALLTAYLEDRPIYVFDEWASDQDPIFKQIFYYEILPDLKARRKAVIVISHDDRYYEVADRIIKLENGQIQYDQRTSTAACGKNGSIAISQSGQGHSEP